MRQTLELDLDGVMAAVIDTGLLSSLCTITRSPEAFDAGGAPIAATAYVEVSGMVDIPCTAPPIMPTDRINASEIRTPLQVKAEDTRHVLLDAYYPTIRDDDRAVIDGVVYEIANVEHDSQHRMTRLAVERITI
jgi:hypothetical protein